MKSLTFNCIVIFLIICGGSDCFRGSSFSSDCRYQMSPLFVKKNWGPPSSNPIIGAADISSLPKPEESGGIKYSVDMTQKSGISWGSDLSFRWIYVLDIEQSGEASASGVIQKGDYITAFGNESVIGMDFDTTIDTLRMQDFSLTYTFFRGSKSQMTGQKILEPSQMTVSVTVVQAGKPDIILKCPVNELTLGGTNIRELLVDNGINVYRSVTRWTNCKGKQRCGTCIVDVLENGDGCTRKSLNENAALLENPESYRLSCITNVYEDVVLEVQGPVGEAAAQIKALAK